ncbi:MAG TPA: TadE family protein [Rhizomicrobium sp.]|nr:TadE family protein [Rhizomicrobium sp.]
MMQMMQRLFTTARSKWVRLIAESRGLAAIEFALIAPVLAVITISISDLSQAAVGAMNMEAAVRSGIQYAMNGGTDMSIAKSASIQSWASRPSGSTLDASEMCICDSGTAVCGQACTDGSTQKTFVTVTATATLGGSVIKFGKTATKTVQVN